MNWNMWNKEGIIMLTAQNRARLRGLATNLKDLVFIGKEGVTDNVINQIEDNLYAHELIKIKVQKSVIDEIKEISADIENRCGAEVVSIIGSKILLYRYTNKKGFKHLI